MSETWKDTFFRVRKRIDDALTPADKPKAPPKKKADESDPTDQALQGMGTGDDISDDPLLIAEGLRRKRSTMKKYLGSASVGDAAAAMDKRH